MTEIKYKKGLRVKLLDSNGNCVKKGTIITLGEMKASGTGIGPVYSVQYKGETKPGHSLIAVHTDDDEYQLWYITEVEIMNMLTDEQKSRIDDMIDNLFKDKQL